jgi:transcriptional regulator with XRE-family HTH domain
MGIPRHDWFLKEWLKYFGHSQQWLADRLDVQKSKVSRMATGTTPYDRDDINSVAAALGIMPFELLMDPDLAHHIRRLRASAADEYRLRAAEERQPFGAAPDETAPLRRVN